MEQVNTFNVKQIRTRKLTTCSVITILGIVINLAGNLLAKNIGIHLYLDSIGTILATLIGGYIPGIAVGILTNLLKQFNDSSSIYYGTINALIAVCTAFFHKRIGFRRPVSLLLYILCLALIGGGLGGILTWLLFDYSSAEPLTGLALTFQKMGLSRFNATLLNTLFIDVGDKALSVLICLLIMKVLPGNMYERYHFDGWLQAPLSREEKQNARSAKARSLPLRTKIIGLFILACLGLSIAATSISTYLYQSSIVKEYTMLAEGTAGLVASIIDPQMVDSYLAGGAAVDGYIETEKKLNTIKASSPNIKYIYVYRIEKDGCHIVFDLDNGGVPGSTAGEVQPFDDSFSHLLPTLLKGGKIDPIITDDSFGWLLTVYKPVYDANGKTVCYACTDISMEQLRAYEYAFSARLFSLFLQAFILILAVGTWVVEYSVVLPVNTMAEAASHFAYQSESDRRNSIRRLKKLSISTGDEIEYLYHSFLNTTNESMHYVNDIQAKTNLVEKMQSGLIFVLADIVESRDKNTGQHVRKTAAYTKLIMEQMRREGIYQDQMTDGFIKAVYNYAPLHDIGKISIPDAILNKPGRLTDEEFTIMKSHTTVGRDIISEVIEIVPESEYLDEARKIATHHHERWDGHGYPYGLAGIEIPLSARIMAVADVFDALVSNRSYKKGFPFEKAIAIIEEGVGTQFDPLVATAFLHVQDEARQIAEQFGGSETQ